MAKAAPTDTIGPMLWRKIKLDWSYAIGELAIVTLGVLVALAIDQWNDDRNAQAEERAILDRLLVDLDQDAPVSAPTTPSMSAEI